MSDDLVKRLRDETISCNLWCIYPLCIEAASRIEKLEAALQAVIRYAGNAGDDYLADKARKTLEGKDD